MGAHLQLGRARREAEERFTAMADLAPALIWVADADGPPVLRQRGLDGVHRPAGRRRARARAGRTALHPEDRDRYLEAVAAATAAQRGWEVEYRLRRADGAYHWLLERAVPDRRGRGLAGYVGSCTDINARYRETERQTLLAAVGAALDRETAVGDAARRGWPGWSSTAGWPTCAPCAWWTTTGGCTGRVAGIDAGPEAGVAAMTRRPRRPWTPDTGRRAMAVVASGRIAGARPSDAGGRPGRAAPPASTRSALALPLPCADGCCAVLALGRRG